MIVVTVVDGRVDVQVRGSSMTVAQYAAVIGTIVRTTAALFADASPHPRAEITGALLDGIVAEALSSGIEPHSAPHLH